MWLEQDEKVDKTLSEIESKNDLLMLHFGKFTKLWNEGSLSRNFPPLPIFLNINTSSFLFSFFICLAMYYHKPEEAVEKSAMGPSGSGVMRGPAGPEMVCF